MNVHGQTISRVPTARPRPTDDPEVVRRLILQNPWAILVSCHGDQLVASHYPVLLDEDCDGLAVFAHVGRPDEKLHGFGEREIMLIVQRVHAYISPSWYAPGAQPPHFAAASGAETQRRVIRALRAPGAYHNPRLADEMERALASEPSG